MATLHWLVIAQQDEHALPLRIFDGIDGEQHAIEFAKSCDPLSDFEARWPQETRWRTIRVEVIQFVDGKPKRQVYSREVD